MHSFPVLLLAAGLSAPVIAAPAGSTTPGSELTSPRPNVRAERALTLRTMGSLFFGGAVTRSPEGETFHGDHGYAQYFIPQNARTYPIVLWHGIGQSGRSYESTPDGREGFMALLPRRDWPVYIVDQPRRGRAGRTQAAVDTSAAVPTVLRESAPPGKRFASANGARRGRHGPMQACSSRWTRRRSISSSASRPATPARIPSPRSTGPSWVRQWRTCSARPGLRSW